MFQQKDKIQGQEAPCRRFGASSLDDINYNLIEAHTELVSKGCSRQESLKFLTNIHCKLDSTKSHHGPKDYQILQLKHNKFHCINGWQFGRKQYYLNEKKFHDNKIDEIISGQNTFQAFEKKNEQLQQNQHYQFTYEERFQQMLNEKYGLPRAKEITIDNILKMKKQVRKLHNILDLKKQKTKITYTMSIDSNQSSSRKIYNYPSSLKNSYNSPISQRTKYSKYSEMDMIVNLDTKDSEDMNNSSQQYFFRQKINKQRTQPQLYQCKLSIKRTPKQTVPLRQQQTLYSSDIKK